MNFVDIVVKNDGGGVARNIKFSVADDGLELNWQYNGKTNISELNFIKDGIELLPHGEKKTYLLMQICNPKHYRELFKKNVIISVSYVNNRGKRQYKDKFRLDFNSLPEIEIADESAKAPKNIVKELKNINKHLDYLRKILRYSAPGITYQNTLDESFAALKKLEENKGQLSVRNSDETAK